jgi:hypothetical protein
MHIFWKHPVAILFLMFYTLLCIAQVRTDMLIVKRLKAHPGMSGIQAGGEWDGVFLLLVGGVFFFVSCCYAIGSKTETKFYLWLIFIVIVETITALNIG